MTIQLDEHSSNLLRTIAATENRTEAQVVQSLLAQYVRQRPLPIGIGAYGSGRSDTSENASQIMKQAARDGAWP